jgi:hypothetical protein
MADKILALDQPVLLEEIESEGVLFSREEMAKRYTAKQVSKLEQLREAVFMLLPMWPVEDIARRLKMTQRTVRALAASDSTKVTGSKRDFVNVLRSTAARWLALARTREHEASFAQLAIGLGIILDKARDLESTLDTGQSDDRERLQQAEDHAAAVARLRKWFEDGLAASPANGPAENPRAGLEPATETSFPQEIAKSGASDTAPTQTTVESDVGSKPANDSGCDKAAGDQAEGVGGVARTDRMEIAQWVRRPGIVP